MGETWFFRPDTKVTREEFLAMAMDLVDLDALPEGVTTGFADEDSISVWARPYVASAFQAGMVQGTGTQAGGTTFDPGRTITGTEAAVLLDRLLQVSDVADTGALEEGAAPAWAWQSVVNLEAVGVLTPENDGSLTITGELTRGQAAEMLQSAIEMLDFRKNFW